MSALAQRARPASGAQPKDPEYRQGLVTTNRDFDAQRAAHLRTSSDTDALVYPSGSSAHYDIRQSELVYGVKTAANSSSTAVSTQRRRKVARLGHAVANAPALHEQPGLSSLNGWRLPAGVDPTQLSDEELRVAIMNQIHVLGPADKDFPYSDGDSGRTFQTQLAGNLPMFGDSESPLLSLMEATVPTPDEVRKRKYSRTSQGIDPEDKVTLITRPVRGDSLATELTTVISWWLRDRAQFVAAMDPRIKETQTWQATCQEVASHSMQSGLLFVDWLQRWGALASWPMTRDTVSGFTRELQDGDDYSRSLNEASHMFYTAVGLRDGTNATSGPPVPGADGATVAGRMRELRRRLRDEPWSLSEAIALASGHVRAVDALSTVGTAAAPCALIDPRTIAHYAGTQQSAASAAAAARNRPAGAQPAAAAAAAASYSFQHAFLRSVFWDGTTRTFMFGTRANGDNRFIDVTTHKPRLATAAGRIIEMQSNSFFRLVAAFCNAKMNAEGRILGRVTRACHRGEKYTMLMAKAV